MTEISQNELVSAAAIALPASGPSPYRGTIDTVYDNVGPQTGNVAQDGLTDDLRPQLSGTLTAAAGQTLRIWSNSHFAGFVQVDSLGHWTFTPGSDLEVNQEYYFQISMTDPATDTEVISEAFHFATTVAGGDDTSTPAAATDVHLMDGVGPVTSEIKNNGITDDNKPTLTGHAKAGDIVKVYDTDNHYLGETTVKADGSWSFTPADALADGKHSFTAVVENSTNSHDSTATTAINFTVSTVHPVSGSETFEGLSTMTFHYEKTVTTDSGLKITAHKDHNNVHYGAGSILDTTNWVMHTDGLSDKVVAFSHLTTFELPGVSDTLSFNYSTTFGARDSPAAATVTMYDANGAEVGREDISVTVLNSGVFTWTAPAGETFASFTINPATNSTPIELDNVKWEASSVSLQSTQHQLGSVIQLGDENTHLLQLTSDDVLSHSQANLLIADGHQQMAIIGGKADVVELKVADLSAHEWQGAGQTTSGGVQYDVYHHAGDNVELLVQHGVELHITA